MITTLLNDIKDCIINNTLAAEVVITNYQYFVPKVYPSVAIDVTASQLSDETYSKDVQDAVYSIAISYIEKAPDNRDKVTFLQNAENLKKTLLHDTTINAYVQGLNVRSSKRDRGAEDNLEFIEEIILVGQIEI